MRLLNCIILNLSFSICCNSQTLTIQFSGIRNNQGQLQIQFYDSQDNFAKEKPLFTKLVPKSAIVNGQTTIHYQGLKPGTYGIAILDDENGNKKMDYGLVLPKEGFGFSDYYHSGMTRPEFDDFRFELTAAKKVVQIKLRYL